MFAQEWQERTSRSYRELKASMPARSKKDAPGAKSAEEDAELVEDHSAQATEPQGPSDDELEEVDLSKPTTALVPRAERSLSRTDPLAQYMSEVHRHPLLTREEEHDLAVKYQQTGD